MNARLIGRACAAVLAAVVAVVGGDARAQQETALSVERLTPAPGAGVFFAAEDADVLPDRAWRLAAVGSLMTRPLVLRELDSGDLVSEPVRTRLGYDLAVAVGLRGRWQLGAALPIVAAQDGDRLQGIDLDERSLRPITLGDARLHGKVRLLGRAGDRGVGLALAAALSLPTGDGDNFAGEKSVTVGWQAIGSYAARRWRAAVSLGPRLRAEKVVLLSPARASGGELTAALAGEAVVPFVADGALSVLFEYAVVRGDEPTPGSAIRGPSPEEARGGLRWRSPDGWTLTAGAGFGTTPAEIGSPAWRAILAVDWRSRPARRR